MVAIRVSALLALGVTASEHNANPIRRVVTMLQAMSNKVVAEGKKEQELFDKFMCYCTNGADELAQSIKDADTKIPQVESALKEAAANKAQFEADVKQHQSDRAEAKEAIAAATALREKQAAEYAKVSSDYNDNIAAMGKAISAIGAGAAGFLQTTAATSVRRLAIDMDISPADRDQVMAFLAQGQGFGYSPKSGQITGILKQMKETMEADLASSTAAEQKAIGIYDELVSAKEKQINADTAAIESKIERVGNLGVEIETMKADLGDTAQSMIEDKKFLADLDKTCKTKQAEWDERCKVRNEELLALADTIKMLNDDDALELFKKTLPGASSFLQTKVTAEEVRKEALQALAGHTGVQLDLISLSLRSKKVDFSKVIKMVDDMVALLKKEQQDDDDKKEMCEMQLDKAEDDLKVLETTIADLEKSLADGKEEIATLTDEIAALTKGLEELDKQVEEAMVNRKEENEDYQSLMANNGAALEIIGMAKNRMNKFYNPSMYEAPASFIQVHMHKAAEKDAPPPPPATWDAYSKKSEESNGVIAMMDSLIADLEKEMQEAELEEKDAQGDYEQFTRDAAEKRVQDSKSITEKDGAKAEAEMNIVKETKERQTKMKEALATVNYIEGLHKDCDWLLKNYDVRKSARTGEVDALTKAKAVLSGADFSLVQTNSKFLRVRK
jgi:chromosome segregation ATPase